MAFALESDDLDRWFAPTRDLVNVPSAIDGRIAARASSAGLDFAAMVRHAPDVGGPANRASAHRS
ncbi:hypothetical protein QNA08_07610 [Chelatococcus sp. SYSU_G07232]|uniref:Uncharacterized protein n=1 Tax=Chelatococcus albus TaxID=3047466 RepID=A0ABT7AHH9_9HYPH|nr:hypothetical protein [Chelatococcus sp. SYSU_G07232]MDJ1158096.1 hypothetical protein [Chelatococcus sp. SYSU_G07232]